VLERMQIVVKGVLAKPRTEFRNSIKELLNMLTDKNISQVLLKAVNNPQLESLDRLFFLDGAVCLRLITIEKQAIHKHQNKFTK